MQLEFDITNLGQPNHVTVYGETTLRITEAVVSVLSLETRVTRVFFARLDSSEECTEGKIDPENNILQYLRMNGLQFRLQLFPDR